MSLHVSTSRASRLAAAAVLSAFAAACGTSNPIAPSAAVVAEPFNSSATYSAGAAVSAPQGIGSTAPIFLAGGPGTNYTCQDLAGMYAPGATWFELKLDRFPQASETVTDGVLTVSIANGTRVGFDFSASRAVDAVFVKSGADGHHLYLYNPESSGGAGLTTPNSRQDISHISFCYDVELLVAKTAATTFTRDYDWTIAKTVDQPAVTLDNGVDATVNYSVAVTKDAGTDSDWSVSGTITVTNPHPRIGASGVSVSDALSAHGALAVSCPSTTLAPLGAMTCSYGPVSLATGAARTNTATATSTTFGIAKGEGSTAVAFVTPTTVIDGSVSVTDTFAGSGLAGTAVSASQTFAYARAIAAASLTCGVPTTIGNTASLATDDGATESASAAVTATLTCPPPPPVAAGCTLTQGYWGTHSSKGPAKYDATWAALENTTFYLSGTTYYGVLQLPTKGNAYYILAHQFVAAKLNILKGATAPAGFNMGAVETFFQTYTPAQVGAMKGSAPVRAQAIAWATTLDAYNNGRLNVSHCGS